MSRWASFNPRARGGRDLTGFNFANVALKFQSTRPRGARRAIQLLDGWHVQVSIHAPAGGATPARRHRGRDQRVSIHAPAGGATETGRNAA